MVLYNTLTRRKEPLEPVEQGKVGIYVCGVTAYDKSHLGHARSAINFDLIVRYIRSKGYEVKHVTNFTDVDDKLIARANELGVDPLELSKSVIEDYFRNMDALKVARADVYPKASETIDDIIEMVKGLVDKGFAYESNGSVYFSVRKAREYGKLSRQTLDQTVAGARIDPSEDKRDPSDFALWKAAKPGEVSWDCPWGKGRPGWHIECSAMCLKHLGKTIDIHGGGTDLIFPHHENEILQSEAYNGAPFAKYWMHNGMLTIEDEKMSKSQKNFFLIEEVLKRHSPETVRFYVLNASYRQPLDYSEGALEASAKALEKLQNSYDEMRSHMDKAKGDDDAEDLCRDTLKTFEERMDDDFSSREAIAAIYDLAREANRRKGEGRLSAKGTKNIVEVFSRFNALFEVLTEERSAKEGSSELAPALVEMLLKVRDEARSRKDFEQADRIRDGLAAVGIDVQDTKDGAVWKRR